MAHINMAHINWNKPFFLNIATGETSYPLPDPGAGIVTPFPTYGNYGGGHYSEGIAFDGTLLTNSSGGIGQGIRGLARRDVQEEGLVPIDVHECLPQVRQ